jgi:hypothetical protein
MPAYVWRGVITILRIFVIYQPFRFFGFIGGGLPLLGFALGLRCGECFWVMHWLQQGIEARGSDFSARVIDLARENASAKELSTALRTGALITVGV